MRPQQNRRMRGRGNNNNNNGGNNQNRKGPNPLTRSYESNGPDVKIRGSAQQIAEKYTTLARDAQTSGDRVMAENYLQHAEHYNRLILAFQAQMPQQQQPARDQRDEDDMDEDEDGYSQSSGQVEQPAQQRDHGERQGRNSNANNGGNNGSGPQPVIEGTPAEVALRQASLGQANAVSSSEDVAASDDQPEVAAVSGEEQAAAPRKPRRPRRPRTPRTAETEGGEGGDGGSGEPVTEAAQ